MPEKLSSRQFLHQTSVESGLSAEPENSILGQLAPDNTCFILRRQQRLQAQEKLNLETRKLIEELRLAAGKDLKSK